MSKIIKRFFIKNEESITLGEKRKKYGVMTGIVGIIVNIILFTIKFVAGMLSGSIAIMADGVHSLTDAVTAVITYAGFRIAAKPGDEKHPFGHQRIEYITGVLLSVFIIIAGIELAKMSFEKVLKPEMVEFSVVIYIIMFLSIFIKMWQVKFCRQIGEEIESEAIRALAVESRNDVLSTIAVIGAMVIYQITGKDVDGITGCVVALFIMLSGLLSMKETVSPILRERPDESLVSKIDTLVNSFEEVKGCHDLVIHNYGPERNFASIHVEIDGSKSLIESNELSQAIEDKALNELNVIMTVKMDPVFESTPEVEHLRDIIDLIISEVDGIHSIHDFRIVEKCGKPEIRFDMVRDGSCVYSREELYDKFKKYFDAYECGEYSLEINFDGEYSVLNKK